MIKETLRRELTMFKIDEMELTYERWWVGKMCRTGTSPGEFKKVKAVKCCGPPSFVYGQASLIFEDGTETIIHTPPHAYKPRKTDVEIMIKECSECEHKEVCSTDRGNQILCGLAEEDICPYNHI